MNSATGQELMFSKQVVVRTGSTRHQFRVHLSPFERIATIYSEAASPDDPEPVARVVGLASGRPRCELAGSLALTTYARGVLRKVATELDREALTPRWPVPVRSGPALRAADAPHLKLLGRALAFTVHLDLHMVTIHTALGPARYVGETIHIDDGGVTQFRLHPSWGGVFGEQDSRDELRQAAVFQWRAARVARAERDQLSDTGQRAWQC